MLDPMAANTVAASSISTAAIQPWFIIVVIAVILVANFIKAAGRKKRAEQSTPHATATPTAARGQASRPPATRVPGVAHQAPPVPYAGTLLNGVPMKSADTNHGHQMTGFANDRMRAEAELKRQLDALDAARRSGQVTAEQYATHREAIFKNF